MDFDLRALPVASAPLLCNPLSLMECHSGEFTSRVGGESTSPNGLM